MSVYVMLTLFTDIYICRLQTLQSVLEMIETEAHFFCFTLFVCFDGSHKQNTWRCLTRVTTSSRQASFYTILLFFYILIFDIFLS